MSFRIVALVIVFLALGVGASWWGMSYYEEQKAEQARAEAKAAEKKKTAQAAQRASEDATMLADLQRQKLAADEALRRAQEDRDRAATELETVQRKQAGAKRSK